MFEPLLSVCMIVKDEEDVLPHAIQPFKGTGCEVLVGDTGSTDRTKEVASSLGATVLDIPWESSFSSARNAVKSRASGQWVLSLDADEMVSQDDLAVLLDALRIGGLSRYRAYEVERRSYVCSGDPQYRLFPVAGDYPSMEEGYGHYISEPNVLLFRNDPEIVWSGAVHESVIPSLDPRGAGDGFGKLAWLSIHNYGRERRRDGKMEQYGELVRKRLAEDPQDHLSWFYDALMRESRKDHAGAVSSFRKSLKIRKTPHGSYGLGMALLRMGESAQAEVQLVDYLKMSPADGNAWMTLLVCAHQEKNMDKMDYYLGKALSVQATGTTDLVRFALYSARTHGFETKVGLYEKLLERQARKQ